MIITTIYDHILLISSYIEGIARVSYLLCFLVGFFRDIAKNEKSTHETHQTLSEYIGFSFVETSFLTIDPFTRKEMRDRSPNFLLYCLDNLDVDDVYPLNPAYGVEISEYEEEEEEEEEKEDKKS